MSILLSLYLFSNGLPLFCKEPILRLPGSLWQLKQLEQLLQCRTVTLVRRSWKYRIDVWLRYLFHNRSGIFTYGNVTDPVKFLKTSITQNTLQQKKFQTFVRCFGRRFDSMTDIHLEFGFIKLDATAKNTVISPNSLVWKFCAEAQFSHSFDSPETMQKLCLSAIFKHQEIRWNCSIFHSSRSQDSHKNLR